MTTVNVTGGELTVAQFQAVAALLGGATQAYAAKVANVTDRTVRNWQRLPEFREALRAGQQALADETLALLHAGAREAIAALQRVFKDREEPAAARVRAAK